MPSNFTVVDLTAQCEVRTKTQYSHELLTQVEGAADLIGFCSGQLWQAPEEFEVEFPRSIAALKMRWRSVARTAGILTVRNANREAKLLSLSLLACGVEPEADRLTLEAYQQHVVRELHDSGFEPAFELAGLKDRPLVATLALAMPDDQQDCWICALLDRCFAASYFRKLGLV